VEVGALLVAQERVRRPDAVPAVVAEPNLLVLVARRLELESLVLPRLTQVHAHHVVLYANQSTEHLHSALGA